MSQSGLHGITGLYAARLLRPGDPADGRGAAVRTQAGAFKYGLVLGNILPDVDFFIMGPAYLVEGSAALGLHRSWSHSLLVQGVVSALLLWLWARGDPGRRGLVQGLWLGMAMHSFADVFLWFSGVRLLWPLPWGDVNLWRHVTPPGWLSNFLGAADYLFFALFFAYLARVARQGNVDLELLPRIRGLNRVLYAMFFAFTVLAFVWRDRTALYNIVDYALFILVFLPVEIWLLLRMRETMARA
ncbi:MAG: metal-dependent hydrolase [Firmicutes bacterium]|nr:metal-dependent hydrolase [Bacillota bacterium]